MTDENRGDEFIHLFSSHEARLRAYILCLLPRWSDAEDVAQRVNLVLWRKFDHFRIGTSFYAWACQIARLEIRNFRRTQGRDKLLFSDDLINAVAEESEHMQEELGARVQALQICVEKLAPRNRDMLRYRYEKGGSIEQIAKKFNRSVDSVYKTLSRIRLALHDCINRALAIGNR
jgi:RNA polymerase sigma-70 factor, ECF subfamily